MKKLLITILIILLLALVAFLFLQGLKIGEIKVLSFENIQKEYEALDTKIQEAGRLGTVDYKTAVDSVESALKKFETVKEEYDELTLLNTNENGEIIGVLQEYDYENLLVKVGNYATDENIIMDMDIVEGNSIIENSYELHFTVSGSYISIIDFISNVENDSTLGFKIENFEIASSGGETLQAKFISREIVINDISEIVQVQETDEVTEETDETTDETTDEDSTKTTE